MAVWKYSVTVDNWFKTSCFWLWSYSRIIDHRKFWAVLHCFLLDDNSTALPRDDPNYNKVHKVCPKVRQNCKAKFTPSCNNSIDVAMVASFLKQYCALKSGFKVWCLSDNFIVYTWEKNLRSWWKILSQNMKRQRPYYNNHFFFRWSPRSNINVVATARSDRKKLPANLNKMSMPKRQAKSFMIGNVHAFGETTGIVEIVKQAEWLTMLVSVWHVALCT